MTGCQRPTPSPPSGTADDVPWAGTPRSSAKSKLARYVAYEPDGMPLSKVVADVFGHDSGTDDDADYQLARRLFTQCSWFKTTRQRDFLWVEPTLACFTCTAGKQNLRTRDGAGTTIDGDDEGPLDKYAKDRARALLSKVSRIDADSLRRNLRRELATELASIEDVVKVLERIRGTGPEYLLLPYRTRFNDEGRAHEMKRRYDRAWDRATAEYDMATAVTLTTDPAKHDSIVAATDALLENFRRLHGGFLTYDPQSGPSRPGRRLDYISSLEFTDSGLPHLHVVFFGTRWLCPHATLKAYWGSKREQGDIVYLQPLHQRNGRWVPKPRDADVGAAPDTETATPDYDPAGRRGTRSYIGKHIATLVEVAEADSADELADGGGAETGTTSSASGDQWKLALYWALGKQFWSGSQALITDEADAGESDRSRVTRYRFVGVARYGDLPRHVRSAGRLLTPASSVAGPPRDREEGGEDGPPPDHHAATGGEWEV